MRLISKTFAALLGLSLFGCTSRPPPAPVQASTPSAPVLLVSLDGFRADYLELGITPNLARLARTGVRAEWMTPSYPSLTFPNHYTLVTGLRPDRHGVVHNTMEDATLGRFTIREAFGRLRPALEALTPG
ncbi:MAG: alkaline phosphatase family protein [Proteobacteria bacterium]|nr:alkaline phosphatase family protein [Pseudomonadota bacterium]